MFYVYKNVCILINSHYFLTRPGPSGQADKTSLDRGRPETPLFHTQVGCKVGKSTYNQGSPFQEIHKRIDRANLALKVLSTLTTSISIFLGRVSYISAICILQIYTRYTFAIGSARIYYMLPYNPYQNWVCALSAHDGASPSAQCDCFCLSPRSPATVPSGFQKAR